MKILVAGASGLVGSALIPALEFEGAEINRLARSSPKANEVEWHPNHGQIDATRLEGKAHRDGLVQCNACRQQYTVTVGTVFERSKIALNKWLLCNHLLCAGKKGCQSFFAEVGMHGYGIDADEIKSGFDVSQVGTANVCPLGV